MLHIYRETCNYILVILIPNGEIFLCKKQNALRTLVDILEQLDVIFRPIWQSQCISYNSGHRYSLFNLGFLSVGIKALVFAHICNFTEQ